MKDWSFLRCYYGDSDCIQHLPRLWRGPNRNLPLLSIRPNRRFHRMRRSRWMVLASKHCSNSRHAQGNFDADLDKHIHQAFQNVELALKSAGGKWGEVFSINSYYDPLSDEAPNITLKYIQLYLPDRKPLWNVFGVVNLAIPDMRIEVVVKASVQ
jgi:enamine deaminase RidA (YjgF/YER057c/UK114 family)